MIASDRVGSLHRVPLVETYLRLVAEPLWKVWDYRFLSVPAACAPMISILRPFVTVFTVTVICGCTSKMPSNSGNYIFDARTSRIDLTSDEADRVRQLFISIHDTHRQELSSKTLGDSSEAPNIILEVIDDRLPQESNIICVFGESERGFISLAVRRRGTVERLGRFRATTEEWKEIRELFASVHEARKRSGSQGHGGRTSNGSGDL